MDDGLRAFRRKLHDLSTPDRHVWVDEVCDERPVQDEPHIPNVDKLLKRIDQSSVYVAMFGASHHGTLVELDSVISNVSFFEIELFRAALLNKPALLIFHREFEPDADLGALLKIILPVFPTSAVLREQTDRSIERILRDLLNGSSPAHLAGARGHLVNRIAQRVFDRRGRFESRITGRSPLLFLGHQFVTSNPPDPVAISRALAAEVAQGNELRRLTRLWFAFRELFGAPFWEPAGRPYLREWSKALIAWNSAAAWYGLHAHIGLGCVATLNSLARVAETAHLSDPVHRDDPEFMHPGAPLGSAWYSTSKYLRWPFDRWRALETAREELNAALAKPHQNRSHILAIRGSVFLRQLRLSNAIRDYEEVVHLRQAGNADVGQIGEALAELGFAYVLTLRIQRGVSMLEEGTRLLDGSNSRPGFAARAYRKLARAYQLTGNSSGARQAHERANALARDSDVLDQLR